MKNKGIFALNLVLTVLVQASMIWYLDCGGLWRKGLTSFGFVLLGVLNLAYLIAVRKKPLRFPVILMVGLVFAMLGDIVLNVNFIGGCNGNLKGIGSLVEGMDVDTVIARLEGTTCGLKATSCPDQLAQALKQAKEQL